MSASTIAQAEEFTEQLPVIGYPLELGPEEIMQLLPHRGEILFAKHVRLLGDDHYQGSVTWDLTSMGIAGHFPSLAVVPGVYLIEAAAQIAGAGMFAVRRDTREARDKTIGVLAGVRRCMFKRPVFPGQEVTFDLNTKQACGGVVFVTGSAYVAGIETASLDFIVAQASHELITSEGNRS